MRRLLALLALAGCTGVSAADASRACAAVAPSVCIAVEYAPAYRCAHGDRAFEVRVARSTGWYGSATVCCAGAACRKVR